MNEEIDQLFGTLICGDEQRAEEASLKLAALGDEILPTLQEILDSQDIDQRWWAVRTIAQMESPLLDLLIKALEDQSQEVKQCAVLAICYHPDVRAIPFLMKLLNESDSMSVNLAATALIAIGKESIINIMEQYSELKGVSRIEATRALACIQDERAIPVLMSVLDEDSLTINYWAEEGLNRLGLGMVYFKPE